MPRAGPIGRFCSARLPCWLRANSGSSDVTFTSLTQSFMQGEPVTSGLPLTDDSRGWCVMPLRLGIATFVRFPSFSSKSAGTISFRCRT